jgi:hypothetical protein
MDKSLVSLKFNQVVSIPRLVAQLAHHSIGVCLGMEPLLLGRRQK